MCIDNDEFLHQIVDSKKKEVFVSKIHIRVDNSDGTYNELIAVIPTDLATHVHLRVSGWRHYYCATMSDAEKLNKAIEDFKLK